MYYSTAFVVSCPVLLSFVTFSVFLSCSFSTDSVELQQRLEYFWPSAEFSDRVLFTIAHDVPKGHSPLWPDDPNELFPGEENVDQKNEESEVPSDESFDEAMGTRKSRKKKKKRQVKTAPKCVEWLGLVNDINGFAAVKLSMPGEPFLLN